MRAIVLGAAAAVLAFGGIAEAGSHHGSYYYTNVSGHHVHRPAFSRHAPRGASARCADASYSFSEHASGTCSHHGGVAAWL
jgi:hypothetical protein